MSNNIMNIPPFPEPVAAVSLHCRPCVTSLGYTNGRRRRSRLGRGGTEESWFARRRSQQQHQRARARSSRRRGNHVRPALVVAETAVVVTTSSRAELSLAMTAAERQLRCTDDEHSSDHLHRTAAELLIDKINEKHTSRRRINEEVEEKEEEEEEEEQVNEADIVCRAAANLEEAPSGIKDEKLEKHNTSFLCSSSRAPVSERHHQQLPPIRCRRGAELKTSPTTPTSHTVASSAANVVVGKSSPLKSTAVQTGADRILYRLRIFPTLKDIVDEESKATTVHPDDPPKKSGPRLYRYFRFLGRVALSQFGLAWLLSLWAILGAAAFYVTEGPREREQVIELKDMQRDLAVGLAMELRQLRSADEKEMEPLWSNKVRQYVARHEKLLLIAVSSGYGEGGGDNGRLWTFPGCVLFAISVLTTLGFGAPVPRTTAARTVALIFAAIGIPAHFLLVLNLGLLLAVKLKRYGIARKYRAECTDQETLDSLPMPVWLKFLPFAGIVAYYILGILCFGVARLRPFSDSLLFPLDFTAAGGLSTITGYVRILYGVFLEGAVTLAAMAVAMLKLSATQSLTNLGLKYGLLVPA